MVFSSARREAVRHESGGYAGQPQLHPDILPRAGPYPSFGGAGDEEHSAPGKP